MTSPWVELIGALIIAIPGIWSLVQQNRNKKAEAKKTESEAKKIDSDRENELIEISRKASGELITQLENRITSLHTAIKDLETKCVNYEKRIDDLEREVERKNRRIDELERSEAQKDLRIKELEARVAELEAR